MQEFSKKNALDYLILGVVFLIPLIWSKYLNANYYSAKFFLVYLISSVSLFASSRRLVWPQLPRFLGFSLFLLALLHFASPFLTGNWVHVFYIFKFLSFVFLAYYFYSLQIDLPGFLKKYDFILLIVSSLILAFALNDFYISRIQNSDITSGFLLGSFGNVNMMSEFLILSLPLLHLWARTETNISAFIKYALLFGWFFFIIYSRSRSAWIGLGFWSLWSLAFKKLNWKEVALLVAALLLYQGMFLLPFDTNSSVNSKGESFRQRLHLYTTTLKMIWDHPFGVGVGQFFNQIIPYLVNSDFRPMEFIFFDQPHSEVLKWAAQFGWIGFILPPVVISFLFYFAAKANHFFLTSSFLAILPQILFQFPFENPASLLYLAFLFALSLQLFPVAKSIPLSYKIRTLFAIVALVGIAHAFAFVTAIFWETSHGNDMDTINTACEIYPVNISACFNREQHLLANRRLTEARLAFIEDFNKFPFHAGLMRLLPSYLKATSTDQKTCEAVLEYNYVFADQTFFDSNLLQSCSVYKVPVVHHDPQQFETDYLKWQKEILRQ